MAKTNAFKIAELIRGIQFDVDNDEITTTKKVKSKDRTSGATTKTATTTATSLLGLWGPSGLLGLFT